MQKVLVLNANFAPLHITDMRRAIKLLVKNRAEIIETTGRIIKTITATFNVPSVIKLINYVKFQLKPVQFTKKNVLMRDRYVCQYCGKHNSKLTVDHIIPKSYGGENTWLNTVTACQKCNTKKGNKPLQDSGLTLLKIPRAPSPYLTLQKNATNEWKEYLFL
jgi:5-methylcytosine-specific restriction endonuclease McrA